jgi:hypothetical protein
LSKIHFAASFAVLGRYPLVTISSSLPVAEVDGLSIFFLN